MPSGETGRATPRHISCDSPFICLAMSRERLRVGARVGYMIHVPIAEPIDSRAHRVQTLASTRVKLPTLCLRPGRRTCLT